MSLLWIATTAVAVTVPVSFTCDSEECISVQVIVCAHFSGIDTHSVGHQRIECKVPPTFYSPAFGYSDSSNWMEQTYYYQEAQQLYFLGSGDVIAPGDSAAGVVTIDGDICKGPDSSDCSFETIHKAPYNLSRSSSMIVTFTMPVIAQFVPSTLQPSMYTTSGAPQFPDSDPGAPYLLRQEISFGSLESFTHAWVKVTAEVTVLADSLGNARHEFKEVAIIPTVLDGDSLTETIYPACEKLGPTLLDSNAFPFMTAGCQNLLSFVDAGDTITFSIKFELHRTSQANGKLQVFSGSHRTAAQTVTDHPAAATIQHRSMNLQEASALWAKSASAPPARKLSALQTVQAPDGVSASASAGTGSDEMQKVDIDLIVQICEDKTSCAVTSKSEIKKSSTKNKQSSTKIIIISAVAAVAAMMVCGAMLVVWMVMRSGKNEEIIFSPRLSPKRVTVKAGGSANQSAFGDFDPCSPVSRPQPGPKGPGVNPKRTRRPSNSRNEQVAVVNDGQVALLSRSTAELMAKQDNRDLRPANSEQTQQVQSVLTGWHCPQCGRDNSAKPFCGECGTRRPPPRRGSVTNNTPAAVPARRGSFSTRSTASSKTAAASTVTSVRGHAARTAAEVVAGAVDLD